MVSVLFNKIVATVIVAIALLCGNAWADVFRTGDMRLSEGAEAGDYSLFADMPADAVNSLDLALPQGCVQQSVERLSADMRMRLLYSFQCDRPLDAQDTIKAPWRIDGADLSTSISGKTETFSVTGSRNGVMLPVQAPPPTQRSLTEIMTQFLWQGALHIWFGWDHLAFVMCLCMIARGRRLLELVSLFTVGHSISLGLSFFEVVSVSIPPVEAVIALSIALMAREALVKGQNAIGQQDYLKYALVIAVFGLIHGLGFASALGELGVSQGEKWPALIFFNIGIEAGQLIFVGALVGATNILAHIAPHIEKTMRIAALYGVGTIGAFWTIERVWGFGLA